MFSRMEEAEERVMVSPVDADREEAQRVGKVLRPEIEQPACQVAAAVHVRHGYLDDQQRRGYREYAVAEGLDTLRMGMRIRVWHGRLPRRARLPQRPHLVLAQPALEQHSVRVLASRRRGRAHSARRFRELRCDT